MGKETCRTRDNIYVISQCNVYNPHSKTAAFMVAVFRIAWLTKSSPGRREATISVEDLVNRNETGDIECRSH